MVSYLMRRLSIGVLDLTFIYREMHSNQNGKYQSTQKNPARTVVYIHTVIVPGLRF